MKTYIQQVREWRARYHLRQDGEGKPFLGEESNQAVLNDMNGEITWRPVETAFHTQGSNCRARGSLGSNRVRGESKGAAGKRGLRWAVPRSSRNSRLKKRAWILFREKGCFWQGHDMYNLIYVLNLAAMGRIDHSVGHKRGAG